MRAMLAVLLLAAAPADAAPPKTDADAATVGEAGTLLRAHRDLEAIALLDPLIAARDKEAAAEKRRVYSGQSLPMTLIYMGMAAKDKAGAVDFGPAYAQALYLQGYALTDLGRLAEAGPKYDRAIALSPMNAQYLTEYGFWLRKQGRAADALARYRQAEDAAFLAGDDKLAAKRKAAALRGEGYVLIDLGKLDEAKAKYEASLKLDPDSPVALSDLQFIRAKQAEAGKPPS